MSLRGSCTSVRTLIMPAAAARDRAGIWASRSLAGPSRSRCHRACSSVSTARIAGLRIVGLAGPVHQDEIAAGRKQRRADLRGGQRQDRRRPSNRRPPTARSGRSRLAVASRAESSCGRSATWPCACAPRCARSPSAVSLTSIASSVAAARRETLRQDAVGATDLEGAAVVAAAQGRRACASYFACS